MVQLAIVGVLVNAFLIWMNVIEFHLWVLIVPILLAVIGEVLVWISRKNYRVIGMLDLNEEHTKIEMHDQKTSFRNAEFSVATSDSGYEGESMYQPPFTIGAFRSSDGINTIRFFSNSEKHEFEVFIKSQYEAKGLASLAKKSFNQHKKLRKFY